MEEVRFRGPRYGFRADSIPGMKAAAPVAPMDVDGPESGTQTVFQANDYGVEVDFDELDEDEQEVSSPYLERLRRSVS